MSKLTEDNVTDRIEAQWLDASPKTADSPAIPARWVVNVRRMDRILRDGEVVSAVPHRHVLEPGADLKGEDEMVARVARAVWRKG